MSDGVIQIRGKNYKLVGARVEEFRKENPEAAIKTKVLSLDDVRVVVQATIYKIHDGKRVLWGSGLAEEMRTEDHRSINATSALENCETSAIGRALASIGMAGTDSYGSAEEVSRAIEQQELKAFKARAKAHMDAVRDNWTSVQEILDNLQLYVLDPDESARASALAAAAEAWFELDAEAKKALWVSTTDGGIFTTKQREIMQSAEFKTAFYGEQ